MKRILKRSNFFTISLGKPSQAQDRVSGDWKNLIPGSILEDREVTWLISLSGLQIVQFKTLLHASHMNVGLLSLLLRIQNTYYRVPSLSNEFWIFADVRYLIKVESSSQLYLLI